MELSHIHLAVLYHVQKLIPFFLFLQLKLQVFNSSNDIWFTFDSYLSHSFYTFAAVFSIVLLFPWIEATTPLFSTVCIPCNSTCSSDLSNGVLPDDFLRIHITKRLCKSTSIKAALISALHKQYTKKFKANPSNSKLLAQARYILKPISFFRSTVIDSVRKAAGVVQITNSTTIAIKTTTSIRSSGLCKPRLLVEVRFGVPRAFKMRALVTLPLRALFAGVQVSVADDTSTTVRAVVVVFWSVSTCKSKVEFAWNIKGGIGVWITHNSFFTMKNP